jgi:hypothetical protein
MKQFETIDSQFSEYVLNHFNELVESYPNLESLAIKIQAKPVRLVPLSRFKHLKKSILILKFVLTAEIKGQLPGIQVTDQSADESESPL